MKNHKRGFTGLGIIIAIILIVGLGGFAYYLMHKDKTYTWEETVNFIKNCEVAFVLQAHSRDVYVTLKNEQKFTTKEPFIDSVFAEISKVRDRCGQVRFATE